MDLENAYQIQMPEGEVKNISQNSSVIWRRAVDTNVAQDTNFTTTRACSAGVEMAGKTIQQDVPDGYTQLEYIESDGNCYIDLPSLYTSFTAVEMKYYVPSGSYLLGSQGTTQRIYFYSGEFRAFDAETSGNSWSTGASSGTHTIVGTNTSCTIDGTEKTVTAISGVSNTKNMRVLGNGTYYAASGSRIYYLILTGETNYNFVPARRDSDNAIGMYDLVTQAFYANSGTGTFVAGDELTPTPSPSDPVAIQSVGDRTVNLVGLDHVDSATYNGVTATTDHLGKITVTAGTTKGSYAYFVISNNDLRGCGAASDLSTLTANDPVIISAGETFAVQVYSDSAWSAIYLAYSDGTRAQMSSANMGKLGTAAKDIVGVALQFRLSAIPEPSGDFEIIVQKGSVPTEYVPYGYAIPVTYEGENLFNVNDITYGVWISDAGKQSSNVAGCRTTNFIECDGATTFTAYWNSENIPYSLSFVFYDDSGTFVQRLHTAIYGTTYTKYSVTVPDGATKFYVQVSHYNTGATIDYATLVGYQVKVVRGDAEPVTKNIYLPEPLRKIDGYIDSLSIVGDTLTVTRKVGNKNFDGTEEWSTQAGLTSTQKFYSVTKTSLGTDSTVLPPNSTTVMSDYFSVVVYSSGVFEGNIGVGNAYVNFNYDNQTIGLDAWKTYVASLYVAGDPLNLVFPLVTATTETYTIDPIPLGREITYTWKTESEVSPSSSEMIFLGEEGTDGLV